MNLSRYLRSVLILATGGLLTMLMILLAIHPGRAAGPWYVAPGGDDGNSCTSPAAPCATINGAIAKASPSDTDHAATVIYTGEEYSPLLLDAEVILSDGWSVSPTSMHVTQDLGDTTTRILTISNQGSSDLEFEVVEGNTHPVLEGLVAYYPFNGSANDVTGNGFDGSVVGATLIPDRYGEPDSAYSFDGLDDYIAIDNTSTFNFLSGGFTLAAWASHSEYNSDNMIIGKHDCGGPNGYYMGVNNGRFQFFVSSDPRLLTTETYQDDKWHFVVGVYDDADQYLYVDSVLESSQPKVYAYPNDLDISIGRAREGCGYFRGEIDEVHIYDRALTEAEIQELNDWEAAADAPWLSTDPVAGAVPAYGSVPLEVTFDATAMQPGAYNAELVILSSDPVTPTVSVPMTMTVEPTANMGWVEGTVTDAGTDEPLEATIVALGQPYAITTDPDIGSYMFWLDEGSYTLQVTSERYITESATVEVAAQQGATQDFALSPVWWYVAPGGDDADDCQTPTAPCATINGALGKPGFVGGDTVVVAIGTYTGTGDEVVLLDKDATLSGGWDETFTTQSGTSTIDGEAARRGVVVESDVTAFIDRFAIRNGYAGEPSSGGCIRNQGTLTLNSSTVSGNSAWYGGGIRNPGTLILNSSTVSGNSAHVGGGFDAGGSVILNNCTVSGNNAESWAGGIYAWGTVSLNNSTVSGNVSEGESGGIRNSTGVVTLQNTILAGNMASGAGPDCSGEIGSLGYNLVGDTSDCNFAATTGDLTEIEPGLVGLMGSPGYHPLLPGSPAIDAGNPAGCTDHLGGSLTTDQRGTPRSLDGDGDGDAICDIGSYEHDPESPIRRVFLPLCTRNYCLDFHDDFSNPTSGWAVMDDSYVRTEYLNGEYRVLSKQSGYFYLFRAPTCDRQNYTVEVDARWASTPGSSYGLIFGLASDYSQYYLFDMNTDYKQFRLLRRDPTGFVTVVPVTSAPAINGGTASNHIKVTRNGTEITLEVNGTVLGTWYDGAIGGLTGVGLVTNPYYDLPTSDARFDNFAVVSLPGEGAPAPESGSVMPEGIEYVAPNARREPVSRDTGWQ